jgi:hypothetical protein
MSVPDAPSGDGIVILSNPLAQHIAIRSSRKFSTKYVTHDNGVDISSEYPGTISYNIERAVLSRRAIASASPRTDTKV